MNIFLELLFDAPEFFVMFWNSCRQVFPLVIVQTLVAMPAAWAFAVYRFRGRNALFFFYMLLMVMPFQVLMVPDYLVLSKLRLLDTHFSIILPGIFSAFPVFIMQKFFRAIPREVIDAARMDGAGELQLFLFLGIPLGMPGILSSFCLNFMEYWNAIEAPMTFLKTKSKLPASLFLTEITGEEMGKALAASVIMAIPSVLIFLWGREALKEGDTFV